MNLDRRSLLGLIGAGAATPAVAQTAHAGQVAFLHGVASGDPDQHSAVFWTRVTPADPSVGEIAVVLEVARDADFTDMVRRFTDLTARAERDFTVKHDLNGRGLEPGREYFYRFIANGVTSPAGRVRTLPQGATPQVNLAVVSCQLYPGGLFNAYEAISQLDRLDAVVHLGDYIYEYGAAPGDYGMATGAPLNRAPLPPHEIISLADYRTRHAQYKTDPDLQAAHARAAFICVWDDHEVANDVWMMGAENHQPATEGDFATRKAAALRAYYEWMPIREAKAGAMKEAINRSFHFGDLASLHMVETRLTARAEQMDFANIPKTADGRPDIAAFEAQRQEPSRDLLGEGQRRWLGEAMSQSKGAGRPWQILGNQVVMARVKGPNIEQMLPPAQVAQMIASLPADIQPQVEAAIQLFKLGLPFNLDSWDGYPAGRERLYETMKQAGVEPIVLAGDSHAFWVNELYDNGGQRRAVEFGTSAISSPSPGDMVGGLPLGLALEAANPEVKFCDQASKGYVLLTLDRDQAVGELRAVSTILAKPYQNKTVKRYRLAQTATGLGPLEDVTEPA
ncbi:MAG: alkaline phosphatase D family protein [Phenylobacterium sp.]|jgi:alkaline phosphatase D|uniref:Alkaline phosphatase n=1 Tax=Brevundimonas mediterranea TaxID=74329 RepID=A0AB37E911_9CAUL|nr:MULTISPECIES: alkaline phosphatase D family protein [Brevundimonas]MDZ4374073.1 alkaline phosphatase D family protein [Phenylobacterium sp.]OYX81172.1 MAG: alkaline phosphatase [Brevundimonas sp. 32-68-21]EDX81672.1 alkaline phosphatase family protein [Brevundimonas sp. BAL3]MBA4331946.1 alkaline phosphatase [Brevundimonas sp.]QIH73604.1 alkaline phosphatase [Brevundimonas mediterranea]